MKVFSFSVDTIRGAPVRMITKRKERGNIVVCDQPDIATVTTVASVWTAINHRALTPKRHAPSTSVTTSNIELAFINKLRHIKHASDTPALS
jgi:hypothetical protein